MTHLQLWHDSSTCLPWLIHMCTMIIPQVCHTYIKEIWTRRTRRLMRRPTHKDQQGPTRTNKDQQGPTRGRKWPMQMREMTHSYSCTRVTWLIHTCAMTWLIHVCAMTLKSYIISESCHTHEWVMSHIDKEAWTRRFVRRRSNKDNPRPYV